MTDGRQARRAVRSPDRVCPARAITRRGAECAAVLVERYGPGLEPLGAAVADDECGRARCGQDVEDLGEALEQVRAGAVEGAGRIEAGDIDLAQVHGAAPYSDIVLRRIVLPRVRCGVPPPA